MATFPYPDQRLTEKFVQTVHQQSKPLPLKRSYLSSLKESIDPLHSSPAPEKHRPQSVDNFVTRWLESDSESKSYRQRYSRSDILPGHSDGNITPRGLVKSKLDMGQEQDVNGSSLPPMPASPGSRSSRADPEGDSVSGCGSSDAVSSISGASTGSSDAVSSISGASTASSRKSLVESPNYRMKNLAENNIYMRASYEELPKDIAELVEEIRKDRDSPGPPPDQRQQNTRLDRLMMGTAEPAVEDFFKAYIFPDPEPQDILYHVDKSPMVRHAVPDVGSKLKVSIPYPDMLYGYNCVGAFPKQRVQIRSMDDEMVANTQGLLYPFFVIEFKADGPGGSGSMWVATNQCLGGSATCVNIAERLNHQLRQYKIEQAQPIDSSAFSIAMTGTEARLHVTWKHHNNLGYYMQTIKTFALQDREHYVAFRKYVRNIIDWGEDKRLKKIQESLDSLFEEKRKIASQRAKSRQPPSPASSSKRKRKSPSSRPSNSQA